MSGRLKGLLRTMRGGIAALATVTASCSGPTGTGVTDARMAGSWQYHAATTATSTVIDGVLQLSVSSSGGISGSLDAVESDASGRRTAVSGIVSGSVMATGSADFELALVGGRVREHITLLRGDSLQGDWIEKQGSSASVTGRFAAPRKVP